MAQRKKKDKVYDYKGLDRVEVWLKKDTITHFTKQGMAEHRKLKPQLEHILETLAEEQQKQISE